jgi:cytochrome c oxidase subunit 2
MIGWVTAMEPADYQAWLAGGTSGTSMTMAESGAKLFHDLACSSCHTDTNGRGPVLNGRYGKAVQLATGQAVTMDDAYVRESIVTPAAKVVAGYQPIMPTYQGLVSEEQLLQLIAYVRSLGSAPTAVNGLPTAGSGK